ncbi:MAG: TonB-dependent receptor [Gammaproteobacteria bacterium]|nr:TonB-dependent receptor [Gammaproteobacteria bacterium]
MTPYFRTTGMDFLQHFLPGQALEKNSHHSVGVQTAMHAQRWTIGLDAESTRGELLEIQPNPTESIPFLEETIYAGKHYDYEVDARTLAVFARYRQSLSARTELTAGIRAERVRYDYDNLMLAGRTRDDGTPCGFGGCRFNRPADRIDTFTNVSPRLGLTHRFNAGTQLYTYLSRGFRAPAGDRAVSAAKHPKRQQYRF